MKQVHAEMLGMDRRGFLRTSGLGLAAAAVAATGLATPGAEAQSTSLTAADIEVLQFALNLEYLEAEFYSYAVTGQGLPEDMTTGAVGKPGATTGGEQVYFANLNAVGPLADVSAQLMHDEMTHVKLIRSVLGPQYTIAKPAIRIDAIGQMNTLQNYLKLARDFEVAGVSAYGGAVTLLNGTVLQTAAQIALVEALHSGNLELLCKMNNVSIAPIDTLDVVPPPSGTYYFDDSQDTALAVIRTPSEVLMLAYLNPNKGASHGGFFPNGFNGTLTTV